MLASLILIQGVWTVPIRTVSLDMISIELWSIMRTRGGKSRDSGRGRTCWIASLSRPPLKRKQKGLTKSDPLVFGHSKLNSRHSLHCSAKALHCHHIVPPPFANKIKVKMKSHLSVTLFRNYIPYFKSTTIQHLTGQPILPRCFGSPAGVHPYLDCKGPSTGESALYFQHMGDSHELMNRTELWDMWKNHFFLCYQKTYPTSA